MPIWIMRMSIYFKNQWNNMHSSSDLLTYLLSCFVYKKCGSVCQICKLVHIYICKVLYVTSCRESWLHVTLLPNIVTIWCPKKLLVSFAKRWKIVQSTTLHVDYGCCKIVLIWSRFLVSSSISKRYWWYLQVLRISERYWTFYMI